MQSPYVNLKIHNGHFLLCLILHMRGLPFEMFTLLVFICLPMFCSNCVKNITLLNDSEMLLLVMSSLELCKSINYLFYLVLLYSVGILTCQRRQLLRLARFVVRIAIAKHA